MSKKAMLLLVWTFLACSTLRAQHEDHGVSVAHGMEGQHRVTVGLGHTHVSEGQVEGKTEWLAIASWTLNYDYWLSDKWAIGLQNDVLLESFVVEHGDSEFIERKYPWAVAPVVIFKPGKHFSFLGGVGMEVSHGKSLPMTRLGMECGWYLPGNWEVGGALVWDNKWNYYNSWGLSFIFSKLL